MKTKNLQCCFFVLQMFFVISLRAQNLVPNPSFESYSQCPTGPNQMYNCNDWYNVVPSTVSNYFNSCYNEPNGQSVDVPFNYAGYQETLTGNGYAGVSTRSSRGYIQTELTEPLVAGQCYY